MMKIPFSKDNYNLVFVKKFKLLVNNFVFYNSSYNHSQSSVSKKCPTVNCFMKKKPGITNETSRSHSLAKGNVQVVQTVVVDDCYVRND